MRIPLDYYRILSVPIKVTSEQLEQAYRDRLLQQPRREYSDRAIKARQELIKHSYQVLSDLEQRVSYDAQFLVNMQPKSQNEVQGADSEGETAVGVREATSVALANPTIDIPASQLLGALSILQELGEYETVLRIGIDRFNQTIARQSSANTVLDDTQKDLILSLVLAYLELGREQWHRKAYENAATSGWMGIDLLNRYSLFPHLQEELELDLHKLRPYRILELISQNPVHSAKRTKGFELLRAMLIQRRGIEDEGADRSGLSFDRFLRFIQQLRTYLTSAEQQQLFDDESQKDSAVATYLAVYALLGRGFSLKQPELIIRAQRKLDSLAEKQDVSWEQAITALLLGHTEKAIHKLTNAPNATKLELVLQHNPDSTDLLPGLCFYGEQWLLEEVVAQFNDLCATRLSLKEYFADRQVQIYLEELVPLPPHAASVDRAEKTEPNSQPNSQPEISQGIISRWRKFATQKLAANKLTSQNGVVARREMVGTASSNHSSQKTASTMTVERDRHQSPANAQNVRTATKPSRKPKQQQRPARKSPSLPFQPPADKTRAVPPSVMQKAHNGAKRRRAIEKRSGTSAIWQSWLFFLSLIVGGGVVGFMAIDWLFLTPGTKTAEGTQLAIAVNQPTLEIPTPQAKPVVAKPQPTFAEKSQQAIQAWLDSKSAAFGKQHQIGELNKILAEPLLSTWRDRALAYKQGNAYRDYEHKLTLRSAQVNPQNRNQATIEAEVREVAKHYQSGQLDDAQSYNDNLLVRYQLVRQGEKWLIQDSEVLQTLN